MVRHPNDPELLERLAQIYQSTNKPDQAEKAWRDLLTASPNSPRAHLALAQVAEVHMDTPTAIAHYDALLAQDPANLPLLLRVGELRYRSNDMAKAQDAFLKAKSASPQSAGPNFWLALLAERRGDWPAAIAYLKQIPVTEKDSGILLRLSYYYSQNKQPNEAVKVLKQLAATDPTNPDFLNYLSVAYEEANDPADAEKTLKQIIKIDPNEAEPHFHLATLYDRTNRFPLAEQELQTATKLKPNYDMALNYLGFSYADKNIKLEEAERLINDAISSDPHNPAYLDSMGWVYYRMGKFDRARDFLTEAVAQANDPTVWDHLGDVEFASHHIDAALMAWEKSLELVPDAKAVRKKYARAFDGLPRDERTHTSLRRAAAYFGQIDSVQGLVKVKVKLERGSVIVNAQFNYDKKAGTLKMEMPGPLGVPLFLITKSSSTPAQLNVLHPQLDVARDLVSHAFDRLWDVLSAAAFSDTTAQMAFADRDGALVSVAWPNGTMEVSRYDPLYFSRIPETFSWREKDSKQSLRLQFVKPSVETPFTPDR
jgi:tetratricopeptide (TPR) repeat protein